MVLLGIQNAQHDLNDRIIERLALLRQHALVAMQVFRSRGKILNWAGFQVVSDSQSIT